MRSDRSTAVSLRVVFSGSCSVPKYLGAGLVEPGEALGEGPRQSELPGVHHLLHRGSEIQGTMDLRAATEAPYAQLVMLALVSMRMTRRVLNAEAGPYECAARSSSSVGVLLLKLVSWNLPW